MGSAVESGFSTSALNCLWARSLIARIGLLTFQSFHRLASVGIIEFAGGACQFPQCAKTKKLANCFGHSIIFANDFGETPDLSHLFRAKIYSNSHDKFLRKALRIIWSG